MAVTSITEYADNLSEIQCEIVHALDSLVLTALPEANAAVKWSQPVYSTNGPCCFIKAHKQHVAFGFWWGAKIDDRHGLLEGTGEKMRHIKVRDVSDIDNESYVYYVMEANRLNHEIGDPTKNKA